MAGWHHRLSGYEFDQAPGDGEAEESLVCCRSRSHRESNMTERLESVIKTRRCHALLELQHPPHWGANHPGWSGTAGFPRTSHTNAHTVMILGPHWSL